MEDDEIYILYRRAHNQYVREHMEINRRVSNTQIIAYIMGLMASGFFLAWITIQWHYKNRNQSTEKNYRRDYASYREERAMIMALGPKKHNELVMARLTGHAKKQNEQQQDVGKS